MVRRGSMSGADEDYELVCGPAHPGHRITGPDLRIDLDDDGTLDEVATSWLHVENMDDGCWHVAVGDARIQVTTRPGEQPTVHVYRGDAVGPETGETHCAALSDALARIAAMETKTND
jgi:hypothetical protein